MWNWKTWVLTNYNKSFAGGQMEHEIKTCKIQWSDFVVFYNNWYKNAFFTRKNF